MSEKLLIPDQVKKHPAWLRMEDQLNWYSEKSALNKKWYNGLKLIQIVLASVIPIISLIGMPNAKYIVAVFGAVIAILEGCQQLYQFHKIWSEYRSTAEYLKHEKYLFLSLSGPYRNLNQEEALLFLAERIEEHISKEHAKWIDITQKAAPKVPQPKKTA